MPRYFVAYRKTEEAGQKPEWASFTTESASALEAHGIRERVEKRLSVFGEKLHGPRRIEEPTFVVEQSGHPRAFAGRAYVPQIVPAGIGPEVIR